MVKNLLSSARGMGLIPGWGAEIPHATGQLSSHATMPAQRRHSAAACHSPPSPPLSQQWEAAHGWILTEADVCIQPLSRVPWECSLPGSSVRGISQADVLEWVGISFSRGSSDTAIKTASSVSPAPAGGFLTAELPGKPYSSRWQVPICS